MQITEIPVDGYEAVLRAEQPGPGFRAMIAVHSTLLGPALGGIRMWSYDGFEEAQADVLRLARGMTYKAAVARTGMGGGKAVVLGDPRADKSDELFLWLGQVVDSLGGRYVAAEDVGIDVQDVELVARNTRHVTGKAREDGGSGDPSPHTAWGTYRAIQACAQHLFGDPGLGGRTVAVQGLGHVGFSLARYLKEAGARVLVSDLHQDRTSRAQEELGAQVLAPEEILRAECDVLAPCALGAILNDRTIRELRSSIVCGAANNQLAEDRHGDDLQRQGVLYAPDFVVNAGGVINISLEFAPGGYDGQQARERLESIPAALAEIFERASRQDLSTAAAAVSMAEDILEEAARGDSASG